MIAMATKSSTSVKAVERDLPSPTPANPAAEMPQPGRALRFLLKFLNVLGMDYGSLTNPATEAAARVAVTACSNVIWLR